MLRRATLDDAAVADELFSILMATSTRGAVLSPCNAAMFVPDV